MTVPSASGQPDLAWLARQATDAEVIRIAREAGAEFRTRPIFPGATATETYADPATGLKAARALEVAATRAVRSYVRHAREEGITWGGFPLLSWRHRL
jgi:hypothetical protein